MTPLLPALLPATLAAQSAPAADTGVHETLRLLDMPEAWVVVLVLLPLAGLVSWAGYFREGLSLGARLGLASLRFLSIVLLMLVLFRPVFVQRNEDVRPAEVLVLLDDSASMRRADAYTGDAASAKALAKLAGGPLEETPRLELARRALREELLPMLARGGYDATTFTFSDELEPLVDLDSAVGRGHATHVGDAILRALARQRGSHVTDVVVLSDGRSNGGRSPLDAARAAGTSGVPVHTVVVGDTRPERNVLVELVEAPTDVLEGDEIAITVRVLGRGMDGAESARVGLEELSANGGARLITEERVEPGPAGERVVLVAPPDVAGLGRKERRFRVSVAPVPDETLLDDNAIELAVHLTPEKIRVLYVDGYPRWEYRFLRELLKRSDENIEAQIYLLSATQDFVQESTLGTPPLREVPTSRLELLENYDVIILGDVGPYSVSPDPAKCEEFLASLREFVEAGGGLLMQAGEYDNPRSFVDTELEELLPVLLDSTSGPYQGDTTVDFRPTLEDPANPHQVVRLHPDRELNRRLWEDEGGLFGFYWYYVVERAKPGAQVHLRHPWEQGRYGRHPLLVTGYFPSGRTMFLAVDSTWLWRFRFEERYRGRFWRNALRWLALGRLKSGNRRSRLDSLRGTYSLDERIVLEARILDEDYRPSDEPEQAVRVRGADDEQRDLDLELVPGREGLYRGSFEVGRPGSYSAWIEENGERVASTEFEVLLPSRENADPSPDPRTMSALASLSGGRSVRLASLGELAGEFPGGEERREPISSRLDDAWDHWWTLLCALALLSAEWITRKRLELI